MWNKLSMKDRAKYIKLGVANGITSLDTIIKVYNKYAEGGELDGTILLPEVVVTPRIANLTSSRAKVVRKTLIPLKCNKVTAMVNSNN
jgi:hypothetical protein